jgi:hypothetical protein
LTFLPFLFQSLQCLWEGYQLVYFLDFKVAKWAVSSLTHSENPFRVYFNIHDSNIATAEFLVISAETACREIERK